jgi:MtrB/PioB family decaheme-associated outer membrane protein
MKRRFVKVRPAWIPMAALAASGLVAGTLTAQTPLGDGLLFTEATFGIRGFFDRPADLELAQFQMYRDDPSGALLEDLRVWWKRDALMAELQGRQVGQRDHRLGVRAGRRGLFTFGAETERTPHLSSTTARMLGAQSQPGEFTLPVRRPHLLEHNTGTRLGRTGVRWDTDRLVFTATPRPEVPFRAEYIRTTRSGDRPMGMVFGGAGVNHREILEPIDRTTHDVRLSQGLAGSAYQVQVSYHFSRFDNHLDAVSSDNPLVDDPLADGAYRGQTALPPSNRAHTLSASGGVNLPYRTRVTGAVSYGWRSQDHALLPHTINPRLDATELPDLPPSLEGSVQTLRLHFAARTRPTNAVTLSARYRLFDLDDGTPDLVLASRVRSDQSVVSGPFERRRYPYARENAGVDVRWSPVRPLSVGAEYAWERWQRDRRTQNAAETREHLPRFTMDLRPSARVALQGSYLWSRRRADDYLESRDLPLLRRFDQTDRDRERTRLSLQLFPLDVLDLSLSYDRAKSDFPGAAYGRESDREAAWAAHVGWSPSQRITLHASYVDEDLRTSQRSRFRGDQVVELDNQTFDWVGVTDETVRTVGVGGTVGLLPRQLDLGFGWDRSRGVSRSRSHNPVQPLSTNVTNRAAATAEDFPAVAHTLNPAYLLARYRASRSWMASLRYSVDRFRNRDPRTDGVAPASGMDVFLGNELLGYTAQYLTLTVTYHPWIPGVRRAPF